MAILQHLSSIALHQALGDGADSLVGFLNSHFADHSQHLVQALKAASDRAWKALEIALAGESLWQRVKEAVGRREDQAIGHQIRAFLDTLPLTDVNEQVRQQCLDELRQARRRGILADSLNLPALTAQMGALASVTPQTILQAQGQALRGAAVALQEGGYRALAWLVGRQVQSGKPFLVLAIRYFFRREVEARPELAQGLTLSHLDDLSQSQRSGFLSLSAALAQQGQRLESLLEGIRPILEKTQRTVEEIEQELQRQNHNIRELTQAVQDALKRNQLNKPELTPRDSFSIRNDAERLMVKKLMEQYRRLPAEQRDSLPGLLSDLSVLGVGAGVFSVARQGFEKVITLVSDDSRKAQAHYNAYRAALEEQEWQKALAHLLQAIRLEPKRFAPFPVGKYQPRRILGAGGFGVAFLCQHRHLDAPLVVKSLLLDDLDRDVENVFQEAKLLSQLDDPAFVRIWDCGYVDSLHRSRPYLVMDYFDGVSLEDYVRENGPMSMADVKEIGRTMGQALQAAHAKNILHRDIKPANILVRPVETRWRVKLIDFGLALKQSAMENTVAGAGEGRTIAGNSIAGTLDYAASEQMGRLPGVGLGPHSDVYGFGKTCYFALLGTPDPDDWQKARLPRGWQRFLADCTAHPTRRLPDFEAVLRKLVRLKVTSPGGKRRKKKVAPSNSGPTETPPSAPHADPSLSIRCPHCRQALTVQRAHIGRKLKCQFCSGIFLLPAPGPAQQAPAPSKSMSPAVTVSCPHCTKRLTLPEAQAAKGQVFCPHCSGQFVLRPTAPHR